VQSKLDRLQYQGDKFVGQVHKAERIEQPGLKQPPMKFQVPSPEKRSPQKLGS